MVAALPSVKERKKKVGFKGKTATDRAGQLADPSVGQTCLGMPCPHCCTACKAGMLRL